MWEFLNVPLVRFGRAELTLWSIGAFAGLSLLLVYVSGLLRTVLANHLLPKQRLQFGVRQSIAAIARYVVLAVGLLIILETLGIDLTTLTVVAGAVGIGVGFGLQSIAANVVSGLIILFERPVKVGDRIEVGDVAGTVTDIRARSTTVLTNDSIAIIIPNSKLLTETVVNWSYSGEIVRFRIPVGVAFDSDVRLVERLLLEAAKGMPDVLTSPAPAVRLARFGDSALEFQLLVWTSTHVHRKGLLVSALNFAILEKFNANNVRIPFPQREVLLRNSDHHESPSWEAGAGRNEPSAR